MCNLEVHGQACHLVGTLLQLPLQGTDVLLLFLHHKCICMTAVTGLWQKLNRLLRQLHI